MRELMRSRGVPDSSLARMQSPAGQDAGARTPAEIALVAIAGVLAALRGQHAVGDARVSPFPSPAVVSEPKLAETFINPVCGMAVSTAAPMHVENYGGEDYYFCCDGCWVKFRQDPAKYAAIRLAAARKVDA